MRSAAAAGVVLAALLVLIAAGGSHPRTSGPATTSLLQPVDPGEVVPASLSRRAVVNWAIANHAVEQIAGRAAACGSRQRCVRELRAAFGERRASALADARMLSGAPGACGQAFDGYVAGMERYTRAGSGGQVPAAVRRSVEQIWHSCRGAM